MGEGAGEKAWEYAFVRVSDVRYQVSGVGCQVSGIRYQVSGIGCQVSGRGVEGRKGRRRA